MHLAVHVIPRSSKNKIIPTEPGTDILKVKLTAPPVDGKANEALLKLLSQHFRVAKNKLRIIQGEKGRKKIVEINI